MRTPHVASLYVAEFIGTFFLVFFGCGAVALSETGVPGVAPFIPIVFGSAVAVMIYAVGHISGAHFNPAVTAAFFAMGRFPAARLPGYICAQILGALLASSMHAILWGMHHSFGVTAPATGLVASALMEFILSFALMFVIASVATDSRAVGELAGIAIGATVALCAFVGGPLTGASMNPARSLGPALIAGEFAHLWLYLTVPFLGTAAGAWVYDLIRCERPQARAEEASKSSDDSGCC